MLAPDRTIEVGIVAVGGKLVVQLERGLDIAERTQREIVEAQRLDDVGLAAGRAQLLGLRVEMRLEQLERRQVDHRTSAPISL